MARPVAVPAKSDESHAVKSASRTIQILEALAAAPGRLSVAELHERLGFPRSSLYALLRTLRESRWVEADESGSHFGIGPHVLLCGTAYLDRDPALPYARQTLEDLRAEVGHTAHFARRDGGAIIYLASREARTEGRRVPRVGRMLPAGVTALGLALLAELTDDEIEQVLAAAPAVPAGVRPMDPRTLANEIQSTRVRGWAHERERSLKGIACVARAVGYRIPATDAISCAFPVSDADDPATVERIAAAVVEHTDRLAARLRRAGVR
ncbi:IclR family transcriptional regulator [Micromonospora deserti]|uniref:Glycerol operon regulatory protein n=1 Tax=Micromonospora deserti TaxID=2070366 RepID=A0A2W2DDH0_9ACTN|nr:helix-turn-helix domain-containing protein [Micromonospora deserti]PZG01929.1 IclR family transcriptional regulator [Micromonospora deserti]